MEINILTICLQMKEGNMFFKFDKGILLMYIFESREWQHFCLLAINSQFLCELFRIVLHLENVSWGIMTHSSIGNCSYGSKHWHSLWAPATEFQSDRVRRLCGPFQDHRIGILQELLDWFWCTLALLPCMKTQRQHMARLKENVHVMLQNIIIQLISNNA